LDTPEQSAVRNEQTVRLAALFIVAVLAIMAITPLETHSQHPRWYIESFAALPTAIAWVVVRKRPERRGLALFRGGSMVVALVGLGGLALFLTGNHGTGFVGETVAAARFPIQSAVYFVAGLLGVAGSVLLAPED
jgi:hypothetical protein